MNTYSVHSKSGIVFLVFILICVGSVFSQKENSLAVELEKAREEFKQKRDRIYEQNTVLWERWQEERKQIYRKLADDPHDTLLIKDLNERAEKFFLLRRSMYSQIVQLRKEWLKKKKELAVTIEETSSSFSVEHGD
ncbi:MAG: hypothetical protein JSW40_04515 [Candidatus Omnitrophota bacterium]|nr:MAG: hypothetical protein JSW40_04515 [Candidatus Omnitrophota bacterium]